MNKSNSKNKGSTPKKGNQSKKKLTPRQVSVKKARLSEPKAMASVASAYSNTFKSNRPKIRSNGESCRIVHRELIGSVIGSVNFAVSSDNSYALNPGLTSSFPWLSTQAQNWEEYRFNHLRFEYYTRCASTTTGSVMLIPDYDASDLAPFSEQIACSYADVVEGSPWNSLTCDLEPSRLNGSNKRHYIRSAALGNNLDIKTYDSGSLFVGTTDGSGAVGWGKLFVSYDVELYIPQLVPNGNVLLPQDILIASGITSAYPYALSASRFQYGPNYFTIAGGTLNCAVAGTYLITYEATATTSITSVSLGLGGGATFNTDYSPLNGYAIAGSGGTSFIINYMVNCPASSYINLTNTVLLGLAGQCVITPVNPNFV
jgi:hypothetical protein